VWGEVVGFEGTQVQKVTKPGLLENKSEALSPAVIFSFYFFCLFLLTHVAGAKIPLDE
jgi:hypothetical protein